MVDSLCLGQVAKIIVGTSHLEEGSRHTNPKDE
jgi:hypothetical protein